jgi:Outer membrane protein beta-barrel domain
MRIRWLYVAIFLLLVSAPASAQYGAEKWEITPFGGYETSGSFPITNVTTPFVVNRLRADAGPSFGTFIDYSLSDYFQAELMWNRNSTSFSERNGITGVYTKAFDSDIDLYHFGLLFMFRDPDKRLRPYIAGGLGFSHQFNNGMTPNRTDFSYGIGGGVKYFPTRHLGFRVDARFVPSYANSSPGTYCDVFGFCYPATIPNYLNRGNFTGGIVFRF